MNQRFHESNETKHESVYLQCSHTISIYTYKCFCPAARFGVLTYDMVKDGYRNSAEWIKSNLGAAIILLIDFKKWILQRVDQTAPAPATAGNASKRVTNNTLWKHNLVGKFCDGNCNRTTTTTTITMSLLFLLLVIGPGLSGLLLDGTRIQRSAFMLRKGFYRYHRYYE